MLLLIKDGHDSTGGNKVLFLHYSKKKQKNSFTGVTKNRRRPYALS